MTKSKKYGTLYKVSHIILQGRDIMRIFKRYVSVVFVCALFSAKVSCAQGFPVLDQATLPTTATQVRTLYGKLKETHNQIRSLTSTIKAMGASVMSFGNFMGGIIAIGSTYTRMIRDTADLINRTTGSNIKIGETLDDAMYSVEKAHNEAMTSAWIVVDTTLSIVDYANIGADIIDQTSNLVGVVGEVSYIGEGITSDLSNSNDPNKKDPNKGLWDQIKESSSNINDYTQSANRALDNLSSTGLVDQNVIDDIRGPINDANNVQNNAVGTGISATNGYTAGLNSDGSKGDSSGVWDNIAGAANGVVAAANGARATAGAAGINDNDLNDALIGLGAEASALGSAAQIGQDGQDLYNKYNNKNKGGKTDTGGNTDTGEAVEEEEEEEEISEEASIGTEIKEALKSAQEKNEKIYTRFNDMLDMQINRLNTNAAENDKAFDTLIDGIYNAKKISEDEKEGFKERLINLKKQHRNIADRNIILIENAKSNYAKEYKEKIADSIENYNKVIDMYIRKDASKEDVLKKGEDIKKLVSSFSIRIDEAAKKDINTDIKKAQQELNTLVKDIKEAEEKYKNKDN